MKIKYAENPLATIVELDEIETKEFWYKVKIEKLQDLLFDAHFHLQEGSKYFDLNLARKAADPDYYLDEDDNGIPKINDWVNENTKLHIWELKECHCGDCTCVPATCHKCLAEALLGINTIEGLNKHEGHLIQSEFAKTENIDEVIQSLKRITVYASTTILQAPRDHAYEWIKNAKTAYEWLTKYKEKHFNG